MGHAVGSSSDEAQEEILWKEQQLDLLEKVLEQLKPTQKECIRLFFIEQLSYEEIMSRTQLSFKEVKSHLQNGKRNLKIMMEQNSNNESN
jgi:RNA polymerase sigma-70 factor (ECF subfamily)